MKWLPTSSTLCCLSRPGVTLQRPASRHLGAVAGSSFELRSSGSYTAGVIWNPTAYRPMYYGPTDTETILYGINNTGLAVGVQRSDNPLTIRAIMVKAGTLIDISGPLGNLSIAGDVNSSGLVCGNVINDRAFIYDSNTSSLLERINPIEGATKCKGRRPLTMPERQPVWPRVVAATGVKASRPTLGRRRMWKTSISKD